MSQTEQLWVDLHKNSNSSDIKKVDLADKFKFDKEQMDTYFKEKSETLQQIAVGQILPPNSTIHEQKDAITERIIHTVNMMKEVLQSNLSLRETISKQSESIDSLNTELFMIQNENEDLREKLSLFEEITAKDQASVDI